MDIEIINPILREQCRLAPGQPVIAGVSGGADSLCLLDILTRSGYPVVAAHFNHHLRPESGQDEEAVRAAAARLGASFVPGGADVFAWARTEKRSVEEAARILRYRFLFEQAHRAGAQAVAVGHTADDQVETVLMHLLRGSGLPGLVGMAFWDLSEWDRTVPLVRPLLGAWRADTTAHCAGRGLAYVTDASNQDTSYTRNRVRLQLIPELERYNPAVKQAVWRMAQVLAGEEEIVAGAVQATWEACLPTELPGCVALDLDRLRLLNRPLLRAVVRRAAAQVLASGSSLREVSFEDVERAADFVVSPRGRQMDFVQGIRLVLEAGKDGQNLLLMFGPGQPEAGLVLAAWPQVEPDGELLLDVPGELDLGGGWVLRANWAALEAPSDGHAPWTMKSPSGEAWEAWVDGDAAAVPLVVRAARPGERFKPLGMQGRSLKLSDFWINEKLPHRARGGWPLVFSGEELAWVPGFRLAHPFRVHEHTGRVLHLQITRRSQ